MHTTIIKEIKQSMTMPVIVAPMFLISSPKMVIEACKEGVIGTFPALNARTEKELEDWIKQIKESLEIEKKANPFKKIAPWGINFIAHKSNKRYKEDLAIIKKYKPPLVIASLGDPSPIADIVHAYNGIFFFDVIDLKFAKKAIEKGADGLILVSNGAGGHGGTFNPFAFVNEIKNFFDGPIVLAGGLTKGTDILAAEILGVDFVYMGTKFISVNESLANEDYKDMVIESNIEDIIYTNAFSGVEGNYLIPSIKKAGLNLNNLQQTDQANDKEIIVAKKWKDIWGAGQGIGTITKKQPIKKEIQNLRMEYEKAVTVKQNRLLRTFGEV